MEIFLVTSVGILFIAGSFLLLLPAGAKKIADLTNKVLFTLDDKIPVLRKPLGILFLITAIYLWYVVLYKAGK